MTFLGRIGALASLLLVTSPIAITYAVHVERTLDTLPNGRNTFTTVRELVVGYETNILHVPYVSRAVEWVNPPGLVRDMFEWLGMSEQDFIVSYVLEPTLSSTYCDTTRVFTEFSVEQLLSDDSPCPCSHYSLTDFRDPLTLQEFSPFLNDTPHVRTMDLQILQNQHLIDLFSKGMNHIPLQPTSWKPLKEALTAMVDCLLDQFELTPDQIRNIDTRGRRNLLNCAKRRFDLGQYHNKGGHRHHIWPAHYSTVNKNRLRTLGNIGHWTGVDKAANTWCWRCDRHERMQAFHRLNGDEFTPALDTSGSLASVDSVLTQVDLELRQLLPDVSPEFSSLPNIFSSYKAHKQSIRYLTNAHNCIFSEISSIVQHTSEMALTVIQQHAVVRKNWLLSTHSIDVTTYPPLTHMFELLLNLPQTMSTVFAGDVTKCFEAIPVLDITDSLPRAVRWMYNLAFCHHSPDTALYVLWSSDPNKVLRSEFKSSRPRESPRGTWIKFTCDMLIRVSVYLMQHAFVRLGDRVWLQILGIAMGFICSPVWCNVYLLFYEWGFFTRLIALCRFDILADFRHFYRYVDDLFIANMLTLSKFFDPSQRRTSDNPFWIYPLDILEIKPELVSRIADTTGDETLDTLAGSAVNYLSFTLTLDRPGDPKSTYTLVRYVKRRELPFATMQYVYYTSNRPVSSVMGIATSQLLPILYVHNDPDSATRELRLFTDMLIERGFPQRKLRLSLRTSLDVSQYPGLTYNARDVSLW